MTRISLPSLGLLLLSLSTSSLSLVLPRAGTFKIIVSTPTLPTLGSGASFVPNYLTINGTATGDASQGAIFTNVNNTLHAKGSNLPIGAQNGALSATIKPTKDAGKGVVSTKWAVGDDSTLSWVSEEFVAAGGSDTAAFWLRMNSVNAEVFGIWGGVMTADSVPATLLAVPQ